MCDISVIIVSWNVRDFLQKCLASIYRFKKDVNIEVFVVDNASSDGSAGMVQKEFLGVRLIKNSSNRGFAAANNQALASASGRYLLFLNPDTELQENTLRHMVNFMDGFQQVAGMGPRLNFSDGTLQESCRHFPTIFTDLMESLYLDWIFPHNRFFNYYHMAWKMPAKTQAVDVPYGACLLVRKECLEKIGLMDEGFFMYYDEIDLCYRMYGHGMKVYYVPDITVVHHGNRSSSQMLSNGERWAQESKIYYFYKHYGMIGMLGLVFNLLVKAFIVWGPVSLIWLISGHPRNISKLKADIDMGIRVYFNALRKKM